MLANARGQNTPPMTTFFSVENRISHAVTAVIIEGQDRMVRRKLTLLVDEELIQRARSLELNISRLTEKAIEETVRRLDSIRTHTYDNDNLDHSEKPQNGLVFTQPGQKVVGRERLELSTFCVSGRCPNQARRPAQSQLVEVRRC